MIPLLIWAVVQECLVCYACRPVRIMYMLFDDSAMIDIARESMKRAGLNGHATFIRGKSSQIELHERVDVVICDHVGFFGFDYGVVDFFGDARRRLLKSGGKLIPSRIRLNIAAVGSQKCGELANGWLDENIPEAFRWLRSYSINSKHAINLVQDDVLGPPSVLGDIDLYADNPEFCAWRAELRIERDACDAWPWGLVRV